MRPIPKMPRGIAKDGKRKIAVLLDEKVFKDVCTFGRNRGWTFSEALNDLAKCGIFDMKEAEEFDKITEEPNASNSSGDPTAHS